MYLEGSDQHRGWFHSSLLEAVGTRDEPPYRSVLTHGFVVDGDGRKMSKSQRNYITPEELIPKYGAEVLRLWVAAEDYSEDIRLSDEILNRVADAYRRIRNTCRFLLGALADFDPERDRVSYDQLEELDRWALLRLGELIARVRRAYDEYQFHVVFHSAHNFCAVDLSALYLDIIKDRLYVSAANDPRRRAAQTVCFEVLTALARLLAPVLTFTADEVWSHIPGRGKPESVHLVTFPEERGEWLDERLGAEWERLLEVRGEVSRALEAARKQGKIGKSVDAVVYVPSAPEEEWGPLLAAKGEALLATLWNVSGVRLGARAADGAAVAYESQDIPGLALEVLPAQALGWKKCERCWNVDSPRVGEDPAHPALCERCTPVVRALRAGDRLPRSTLVVVLILDQVTKALALAHLPPGPRRGHHRRLLLAHPGDESGTRLRIPVLDARGLAVDRGAPVDRGARRARRGGAAAPARPGAGCRASRSG